MINNKYSESPIKYKKFLLVYNPVESRKRAHKKLQEVTRYLSTKRCFFEVIESKELDNRKDLKSFDTIVAIGGDGTVLSVLTVVSKYNLKMGIIPCGTANLFASGLSIPVNVEKAADILFDGRMTMIDIGQADGKYFALRVGMGYDADIISGACTAHKDKLGYLAYFIEGIKNSFNLTSKKMKITIDGNVIEVNANSVIVANAGNMFRNIFKIAPECSTVDGKLDVFILTTKTFRDFLKVFFQVLVGRHINSASVIYDKGANITIETTDVNTHIDGEPLAKNCFDIRIIPKALKVLVPAPIPVPIPVYEKYALRTS